MHPAVFYLLFIAPGIQKMPLGKTGAQYRFVYMFAPLGQPLFLVAASPWHADHTVER